MVTRREANTGLISAAVLAAVPTLAAAQPAEIIALPSPRTDGGKPLMQALMLRHSTREFAERPLPREVLSDLLWAANGVNRPASGERTAPYWRHIMLIDIYAAMANGVFLYDPAHHALVKQSDADIRALTGQQPFVRSAPLNLVYVAHGERMPRITPDAKLLYASADACFIGQNVYLYCASEGLACVFRASIDNKALGETMKLGYGQFVTFAQSVGYPKTG